MEHPKAALSSGLSTMLEMSRQLVQYSSQQPQGTISTLKMWCDGEMEFFKCYLIVIVNSHVYPGTSPVMANL